LLFWINLLFLPVFLVGVAAHLTGEYRLLSITPFRHLPVVGLLTFFLVSTSAQAGRGPSRPFRLRGALLVVFVVAVALFVVTAAASVAMGDTEFSWPTRLGYRGTAVLCAPLAAILAVAGRSPAAPDRTGRALGLGMLLMLVVLTVIPCGLVTPYRTVVDRGIHLADVWTRQPDDWDRMFEWLATRTAPDTVVLVPPWRSDATLKARRPQVAHWSMPRYDHLASWRRRVELLVGELPTGRDVTTEARGAALRKHYLWLPSETLDALAAEYGASVYITDLTMLSPVIHEEGSVRAYLIGKRAGEP
jgi:hypothetical protein